MLRWSKTIFHNTASACPKPMCEDFGHTTGGAKIAKMDQISKLPSLSILNLICLLPKLFYTCSEGLGQYSTTLFGNHKCRLEHVGPKPWKPKTVKLLKLPSLSILNLICLLFKLFYTCYSGLGQCSTTLSGKPSACAKTRARGHKCDANSSTWAQQLLRKSNSKKTNHKPEKPKDHKSKP